MVKADEAWKLLSGLLISENLYKAIKFHLFLNLINKFVIIYQCNKL